MNRIEKLNALSVYELADMVGCAHPRNSKSEGAEFLADLRDDVAEKIKLGWIDSCRDLGDLASEIGESAPEVNTYHMVLQFADLELWSSESLPCASGFEDAIRETLSDVGARLATVLLDIEDDDDADL